MPTTFRDVDNQFKLYLDKSDSQGLPSFLVAEREVFLNDAQLYLARKLTARKSDDQDAVDLRRVLSRNLTLTLTKVEDTVGEYTANLPDDYLSYGKMLVNVSVSTSASGHYAVPMLVSEDELLRVLTDPFNRPTTGNPVLSFVNNQLSLYTGQDTAKGLVISYYRLPTRISVNGAGKLDLPEALVPSLVQRAVQLALESIQDPRFQTQNAILQSSEMLPDQAQSRNS